MPYDHNFVTVIVDFTVKLLLDFNKLGQEGEKFHQWSSLVVFSFRQSISHSKMTFCIFRASTVSFTCSIDICMRV